MSTIKPSHQPTPPNVHTATKRAVAIVVDPPHVDDTSPVQQRLLFARNSAAESPQDLFEDLASDEDDESPEQQQLSRRPPSKSASTALPLIISTQFSLTVDDGSANSLKSAREQLHHPVLRRCHSRSRLSRLFTQHRVFAGLVISFKIIITWRMTIAESNNILLFCLVPLLPLSLTSAHTTCSIQQIGDLPKCYL
jgi:hypothetical protein